MTKRETIETMSDICNRALVLLAAQGIAETKLNLMMDLEYIDCIIDLDFDRLLAFDDGDFGHDIAGIYQNWDRATKEMENGFVPRCSKGAAVDPLRSETDDGIVTVIDENVDEGYVVVVEYAGHIERYDFGADVERLGAVEFSIEAFRKNAPFLFDETTIAGASIAQGVQAAKDAAFDLSRAINLYLMAARDLGTNLGGYDLVDLLADKTDWNLDKCRRLANAVVADPAVVSVLIGEGVPDDIDPPGVKRQRKPYAGTQFESDDDDDNGPVYGADHRPENDDPGPYQA